MSFTRIPRANFSARASALLLAAAAFAAGAADTPAPAPSVEAQVQALAAKLGSDDPDERGNALEALIALGPGARAALEAQQAKAKDLDLKAQLRIALAGLDAGSAMARYERPKTIDLAAKGITVGEALNRLQEHFSWKVNASDEAAAKTLDLELKGATFFQTVEAIRAGAKLDFANTHGPWQQLQAEDAPAPGTELPVAGDLFPFKLVPAGPGNAGLAAFAAGPFLVYLQGYGIYAMRRLAPESGMATEQKTATLQVCVVAEPGVPVASVKSFNIALKDAKGTVLCGEQDPLNGFGGTAPFQAGGAQSRIDNLQFQVDAEVPGPLSWTGKLNATVPLKMETYRIEDLDAAD
ncbi:MAG: hypothetical protein L6R28_23235, partial [Planctomycetes bacterium]|nr:hypothetical protein [Planctomycetota bacterium]